MTDRQPSDVTNLDGYGSAPLPWSRPHDLLTAGPIQPDIPFFLGTVGPNNHPHIAGIGAIWIDGDIYFTTGPETRKARNLAANPVCTIAARLPGIDLVLEGTATRVTDAPTLEEAARVYRAGGWPAEVADDALTAPYSAPSAGPPPWNLYRLIFHTAIGVANAEPSGATRWRFDV